MARYIDADKLIAEYDRVHIGPAGGARKLMVEAPTADVVEVQHGYWKNNLYCSVCGYLYDTGEYHNSYNYCPDCGAKMDEML